MNGTALGIDDPIVELSDRLAEFLDGQDGGTATAALALTLCATLSDAAEMTGSEPPLEVLTLQHALIAFASDVIRARAALRQPETQH